MTARWDHLRRAAEQSAANRIRRTTAGLRWRQRADIVLTAIVATVVVVAVSSGAFMAYSAAIRPWFDPPVLQPVRDDRILTNIHDPEAAPLVDALTSPSRGETYFARIDGTVHVLDAETLLFSDTDTLPDAITTDLAQITTLCQGSQDCDDVGLLALSDAGGVAVLEDRSWRTLISDQPWIGRDGEPVDQDQIVSWSLDDTGRWLLIATATNGVAMFDQVQNIWHGLSFAPEVEAVFSAATVAELASGDDGFAIATDIGLFTVQRSGGAWRIADVETLAGTILDLAPTPFGDFLAILQAPCAAQTDPGLCLSIWRGEADGAFARVVGEDEQHPDLGMTGLHHVAWQSGLLVTFGAAGIHRYDPVLRGWTGLLASPIDTFHATADGQSVYFAAGSTAGEVRGGRIAQRWDLEENRLRQILPATLGSGTRVLGLTEAGLVMSVASGEMLTHPDPALPPDMRILRVTAMGNVLALVGPQGVFLVDLASRRRAWVDAADLPVDLTRTGTGISGSPAGIWYWNAGAAEVGFLARSGDWPNIALIAETPLDLGVDIVAVTPHDTSLSVTLSNGQPLLIRRAQGLRWSSPVGLPLRGPRRFSSMAVFGQDLAFSDGQQIDIYRTADRSWIARLPSIQNERITDIAAGDNLFALTDSGRIYRYSTPGQPWVPIFGLGLPARFASSDLSDAMINGTRVMMAGDGAVMEVVPDRLEVARVWSGGRGAVQLLGMHDAQPVWLSNGILRVGQQVLTPRNLRTEAAIMGQNLVLQHLRVGNSEHLRQTSLTTGAEACQFLSAPAPDSPVLGGHVLPGGAVYVQAARGTHLYVPEHRRWLTVTEPDGPARAEARAFVVGDWLFDLSDDRLRGTSLATNAVPQSCGVPRLSIDWTLDVPVTDIAVDEAGGRLAFLRLDGAVQQFEAGLFSTLLPANTAAPATADLRQVLSAPDGIIVTDAERIWSYHASRRNWTALPVTEHGQGELFVQTSPGNSLLVTQWGADGSSWGGSGPMMATGQITTSRLAPPSLPGFDIAPETLIDMGLLTGRWLRLTEAELALSNAVRTDWTTRIALDTTSPDHSLSRHGTMLVVTTEAAAGQVLHIIPDPILDIGVTTLAAISARYSPGTDRAYALVPGERLLWRIDVDGRLLRCTVLAGRNLNQQCEEVSDAPLALNSDDLGRVITVDGAVLAEIGGAFQWISTDMRRMTDAGLALSPQARIFRAHGSRYAFDPETGTLWQIRPGTAEQVQDGLLRTVAVGGEIWLESGEGTYLRLTSSGLADPLETALPRRALTLAPTGELFHLEESGQPMRGETVAPLLAPLPADTASLLPGRHPVGTDGAATDGWWTQSGDGRVNFHFTVSCEVVQTPIEEQNTEELQEAEPHPPALPPESAENPAPPEQVFEPCAETLLPAAEPVLHGRLGAVEIPRPGWVRLRSDEEILDIALDGSAIERSTPDAPVLSPPAPEPQTRDSITDHIETVAGQSVLAPNRIAIGENDIRVTAGVQNLRYDAAAPGPVPAFDAGWLAWDRAAGGFLFASRDGTTLLSPAEAILDGRLLSDQPGRAAMREGGGFAYLTGSALWHYGPRGLPELQIIRNFPAPIGLSRGVFILPSGGVDADTGASVSGSGSHTIALGDMTLTEHLRPQHVSAAMRAAGGPANLDPFAAAGFLFDRRTGLSFDGADLLLRTELGFLPLTRLTDLDPGPNGIRGGTLVPDAARPQLGVGGNWWERAGPGQWDAIADPQQIIPLGRTARRDWAMVEGALQIRPLDAAENWHTARDGMQFDTDRLRAIARDGTTLLLLTDAATEAFPGLRLPGLPARGAAPPLPADRTAFSLPDDTGQWHAFSLGASGVLTWQPNARDWQPPPATAQAVWQSRRPVVTANTEITIDEGGGLGAAQTRIRMVSGGSTWRALEWQANRYFAQNQATALHVSDAEVLIGTEAGLRHLSGNGNITGELYDLAASPATGAAPAPVTQIGHPADAPDIVVARGNGALCTEVSPGPNTLSLTACSSQHSLASRFVTETPLWAWWEGDQGLSAGYFVDGQLNGSVPVRLRLGAWPHDRLRAWSNRCNGAGMEVWQDADVSLSGDPVRGGATSLPAGFEGLFCAEEDQVLGQGQTLSAGQYLNPDSDQPWRRQGTTWQQVQAPQAAALAQRASGALPYGADRYRVLYNDREIEEQYLSRTGDWRTVPPGATGLALGSPQAIGSVDGQFLIMGEAGVLAPRYWPDGLGIDPDQLHLWTEDIATNCAPNAVAATDGQTHGLDRASTPALVLRCADHLLSVVPDPQTDIGAITALDTDPFQTADLAGDGTIWTWQRTSWPVGDHPVLSLSFRGEPMALSGGRLAIDAYRGIAAAFDDRIETVTASGWWRSDARTGLPLFAQDRADLPLDPGNVTALAADDDAGTPALCLSTPAGAVLVGRDETARQVQDCGQIQGRDDVWTYRDLGPASRAEGPARNGPLLERALVAGRFADLSVFGQAVLSGDGREILLPATDLALALDDRTGRVVGIYALPGIMGLARDETGAPMAVTRTGLERLDGEGRPEIAACPALAELPMLIGEADALRHFELSPLGRLNLRLEHEGEAVLLEVDCQDVGLAREGSLTVDIADALRFQGNARRWNAESSFLALNLSGNGAMTLGNDAGREVALPEGAQGGPVLALAASPEGHGIYLVTPDTVLTLDRDAALERLYGAVQTTAVAPPLSSQEPALTNDPEPAVPTPLPDPHPTPAPPPEPDLTTTTPAPRPERPESQQQDPVASLPYPNQPARLSTALVTQVQTALTRLNLHWAAIDGIIGPQTTLSVQRYQRSIGERADGILTNAQLRRLLRDGGQAPK